MKTLWQSFSFLCCITVLTGIVYPGLVGVIGQVIAPEKARGSLVRTEGRVVGSSLIAQPFREPGYFWPRPLVVSNLAPTSAQLKTAIQQRRNDWSVWSLVAVDAVPEDLLSGSASGVDPHISPEAARVQLARVAKARSLDDVQTGILREMLKQHAEGYQFLALGEPRVNVLLLNMALDEKFGALKR